jgi:hypothetical protein
MSTSIKLRLYAGDGRLSINIAANISFLPDETLRWLHWHQKFVLMRFVFG